MVIATWLTRVTNPCSCFDRGLFFRHRPCHRSTNTESIVAHLSNNPLPQRPGFHALSLPTFYVRPCRLAWQER